MPPRNLALALHGLMTQSPLAPSQPDTATDTRQVKAEPSKTPDGTPASYMGPDQGPFQCSNCEYFTDPSICTKPEVLQEVGPDPSGQGAQVDPGGCCNFFQKKG